MALARALLFGCRMFLGYRTAQKSKAPVYVCVVDPYGVPQQAAFIADGREAWRISVIAVHGRKGITP